MRRELPKTRGRARGGAREERQRGALGHLGRSGDAAVRLHHQQHAAEAERAEPVGQRAQVALDDRPDVGVEHRRGRPVVEADLGQEVAGGRDVRLGEEFPAELPRSALVVGVGGRVHEADRDRLDARRPEGLARRAHLVERERRHLLPGEVEAALDPQPQVAGDERRGWLQTVVVRRLAQAVAQGERVAEAPGREQPGLRTRAGQHGVGRHRRPMDDHLGAGEEGGRLEPELGGDLPEPRGDAVGRVLGRRARLVDGARPVLAEDQEVRERPADVDADPVASSGAARAQTRGLRLVDAAQVPVYRDPVAGTGLPDGHQAVAHLLEHAPRIA